MNEAFRLSVGARRIGPREEMAQPEALAAVGEASRAVSGAVVGHHTTDSHTQVAEVGDGGFEEGGDTVAGLVGMDLDEADAGVVVDADVDVVAAGAGRALAAVAGDAVAGLFETGEFLDVEVQQLTGMFPLVASDGRSPFEHVEAVEPCPAQDSADGGGRDAHGPGNLDPRLRLTPQRCDAGDHVCRRGSGLAVRPRTAVGEAVGAFRQVTSDPLAHGARTDARSSGDEAYGRRVRPLDNASKIRTWTLHRSCPLRTG